MNPIKKGINDDNISYPKKIKASIYLLLIRIFVFNDIISSEIAL